MPTSDLGWPHHTPVFQVYGTKRKNGYGEEYESVTAESQETMAKRPCTEQSHIFTSHYPQPNVQSQQVLQPSIQTAQHHDLSMTTQPASVQNQAAFPHTQQSMQESTAMDFSDHPATSEVDQQLEAACDTMESDFVPNSQQYGYSSNYSNDELSPRSARVRCYCKPSWDGMYDMKPYVSDIY